MKRKVLSGTLIILSSLLLISSLFGVGAAWYYNEPLTNEALAKLTEIDKELEQAQTALQNAQDELKRALRIVESAEESLASLNDQKAQAVVFLDAVTGLLDNTISPSLQTSKEKLAEVQENLDELSASIEMLNKIPFVDMDLPDTGSLDFFVDVTNDLEKEIDNVGEMAEEASTFLNDTSYLLGGDLEETKENVQDLMEVVDEYEKKIDTWREKITTLVENLPRWLDHLSALLAIFLLWFALSQCSLIMHGLELWRSKNDESVQT